jgi:ligand-binding sensor domain-containing protein/signal transduction histidine kinase
MKILYVLLLLLLFCINQKLKAELFNVEKIESEGGFPSNLVYKIYQDSKGFIWFGTMYGLYRYDGVNYNSYRYNPFDSTSIGNDDVISIFEDSNGYLWFGTYMGGASRYDSKTSTFTRFVYKENSNSLCDNTVWSITEDMAGVLWFGTSNGLSKFENNNFTTYHDFNGNNKSNHILSLAADSKNNLWIGSFMGGLYRFNPERNKFDNFKRNISTDSINGNVIRGIYHDKKGNIWFGMVQRGVCMISNDDIKKGEYKFNKKIFDSTVVNAPGNATIYEITENKNGDVFFSSSNNVYQYSPVQNKFSKIILSTISKGPSENIAMICDISNCLWVSSYENCLYKAVNNNDNFSILSLYVNGAEIGNVKSIFYVKNKNRILVGSNSGLFEYDETNKKILKIDLENKNVSVNDMLQFENDLFLGTDNGLICISGNKEEKLLMHGIQFTKLIADGNTIVAGTQNGIYFINSDTYDTIAYKNEPGNKNSLSDNIILSLYKDKENNIWAGTYAGLNKYNGDSKNFIRYSKSLNDTNSLSNNYIYSILQKDENNLFLGTAGGINKFNSKENKVSLVRESTIHNSVINSMLIDGNNLWMGTNNGIARMNLTNSSIKIFPMGATNNIFNPDALIRTENGNILAGSRAGLVLFNPNDFKTDTTKPIISFSNLKVFNEKVNIKSNDKKIETLDLSRLQKIELDYTENNLQVDFALMDFNNPKKNLYEYRLEGIDENWISAGNKNYVFYSNLNPGKYELKIRGVNYEGIMSDEKSLTLIINPPFWRTLWFYLLLLILSVAIIILIYKYRLQKNIKLALEIEHAKEEEREKWREQASIDYHDELGHKLTRISMYSRRVLKRMNGSSNEIGEDVNNIIETSNSLRMSARDLIWSLNPSEDSLYDFITRINLFADELFENSGIKYHKIENCSEWKSIELKMDVKRQMLFVLKEAMNNSLKYSQAGNIVLNVINEEGRLKVEITDDGIGFENKTEYPGYGLLNMQKRAKKAGFALEINSSVGRGTKIIIYNVVYSIHSNKIN